LFTQSVTNIQFGSCNSGDLAVSVEMEADTTTEEISAGRFRTFADRSGELEIWNYELYTVDVTVYVRCIGTAATKSASFGETCFEDPIVGRVCEAQFNRANTTFIPIKVPVESDY